MLNKLRNGSFVHIVNFDPPSDRNGRDACGAAKLLFWVNKKVPLLKWNFFTPALITGVISLFSLLR